MADENSIPQSGNIPTPPSGNVPPIEVGSLGDQKGRDYLEEVEESLESKIQEAREEGFAQAREMAAKAMERVGSTACQWCKRGSFAYPCPPTLAEGGLQKVIKWFTLVKTAGALAPRADAGPYSAW